LPRSRQPARRTRLPGLAGQVTLAGEPSPGLLAPKLLPPIAVPACAKASAEASGGQVSEGKRAGRSQ